MVQYQPGCAEVLGRGIPAAAAGAAGRGRAPVRCRSIEADFSRIFAEYYLPKTVPEELETHDDLRDLVLAAAARSLSSTGSRASSTSSRYSQLDAFPAACDGDGQFERDLIHHGISRAMGRETQRLVPSPLGIRTSSRPSSASRTPSSIESSPASVSHFSLSRSSDASTTPTSLYSDDGFPKRRSAQHSRASSASRQAPPIAAVSKFSPSAQAPQRALTDPRPRFSWESTEAQDALYAWMTGESYNPVIVPSPIYEPQRSRSAVRQLPPNPPPPTIPERNPRRRMRLDRLSAVATEPVGPPPSPVLAASDLALESTIAVDPSAARGELVPPPPVKGTPTTPKASSFEVSPPESSRPRAGERPGPRAEVKPGDEVPIDLYVDTWIPPKMAERMETDGWIANPFTNLGIGKAASSFSGFCKGALRTANQPIRKGLQRAASVSSRTESLPPARRRRRFVYP